MTRKINLMMMFTAVLLLLSNIQTTAQSAFWTENFSSSTQYAVTLGAEGNNGSSDYFQRTDGANINKTYAQANGYFFAGQDIDDSGWSGSASPSQITWSGIDISGQTNIEFSGMFGEIFDSPGDIDNNDYLYLEYRIDGGSWDTLIAFRNDGSTYNSNFYEDTNLDGIGDGALISNDTLNNFTKSINSTGSLLNLRFTAAVNSGDEDFAIDEFQLSAAGSAPSVSYLWQEDFPNDLAGIDTVSVLGAQKWYHDTYGADNNCAVMSGYDGGAVPNEDWLISPAMDFSSASALMMTFAEAINYESNVTNNQEVMVSTDYNGDPAAATWTKLNVTGRSPGDSWSFVDVDTVDLSAYAGMNNVHVAFKYNSDSSSAGTWEIDYVKVFKDTSNPVSEPADHVTNFIATAADSTSVDLSWTDAPNTNGYLIKVTSLHYDSISTPVDNVNESMDLNLDDGYGTILIGQNAQGLTIDSLDPNTVYYFKIYPFNASATLINYKNNGSVPQDTAKTDPSVTSIKDQVEMISLPYINSQQNLTFDLQIDEDVVARLYSLNGQLLRQTKANGQHRRVNIPVGNFNNRIFILSVEGQSSRNIFKVSR